MGIGWMSSRQTMKSLLASSREIRIPNLIVLLLKGRLMNLLIAVLGSREKDALLSEQLDTAASYCQISTGLSGSLHSAAVNLIWWSIRQAQAMLFLVHLRSASKKQGASLKLLSMAR